MYNLSKDGSNSYKFITDHNITYCITFIESDDIPGVITFAFFPISDPEERNFKKKDVKIQYTVVKAVEEYLKVGEKPLLALLSDAPRPASCRYRLFQKWYQHFVSTNSIHTYKFVEKIIVIENQKTYLLYMYNEANCDGEKLGTQLQDFFMITEKYP